MWLVFTALGVAVAAYYAWWAVRGLWRFYRGHFTGSTLNFKKMSTAIITGASDGIGKAYAMELARQGLKHIVLIARNEHKLHAVAEEIAGAFPEVDTRVVVADFERTDIYGDIEQQLADMHDVDILVNNVGANVINGFKFLHDIKTTDIYRMININVISTILMSQIVVKKMVADKRRGAIINMSSAAANHPPFMMLYATTKTFVSRFSEALRLQYQNEKYGITVQTVEPYFVQTKLAGYIKGRSVVTAETFAEQALMTLGHLSTTPGAVRHEIVELQSTLSPQWLNDYVGRRTVQRIIQKAADGKKEKEG